MDKGLVVLLGTLSCFIYQTRQTGNLQLLNFRWRILVHPLRSICNISEELLKVRDGAMIRRLYAILKAVWQSSTNYPDWKRGMGMIVPIWKGKGSRHVFNNCISISPLSGLGKFLCSSIIDADSQPPAEEGTNLTIPGSLRNGGIQKLVSTRDACSFIRSREGITFSAS